MPHPLLDLPAVPDTLYAGLADRIGALLGTAHPVLLIQGEAVVALEAVAASLSRPGFSVLNLATSPYGVLFGTWLTRAGARVKTLSAAPGLPIDAETVETALAAGRYDAVALVHAESASGILNPLPAIAALAKAHGALLVVDAVASIGGHAFSADSLGVDIAVIGPQKALGGSAGTSAVSVSAAAWRQILAPGALTESILSLADQKRLWLDCGRGALPGTPSALEFSALAAALDRIEAEGLAGVEARHLKAARASHAGLTALGLAPFVPFEKASRLVTTFRPPVALETLLTVAAKTAGLSQGVGPGGEGLIRLNHTGPRAHRDAVETMMATTANILGRDMVPALAAVADAYKD